MASVVDSCPRRTFDPGINAREAKAFKVSWGCIADFKRRHDLPADQPLSQTAAILLQQEIEADDRTRKGDALHRAQALALLAQRVTPEAAMSVAACLPSQFELDREGFLVWEYGMKDYLLNRVEALTGKRYAVPGAACKRAATLAPAASDAAALLQELGADRPQLWFFWGVILRLDQLEGAPPADPAAFGRWSQLLAYRGHTRPSQSLGDVLAGRMCAGDARRLLDLPESGPLDPGAIRAAYRAEARKHHPDAGGDRRRFEQLSSARDRLLREGA